MKPETKLARVFTNLAESGRSTDNVASDILAIVREANVKDTAGFDPLVRAAYAANGWNPHPGRPTEETAKLDIVPATVRTYVTAVRRAFRRDIDVAKMKTFYELRKALRTAVKAAARRALRGVPKEIKKHFTGVEIDAANDVNGALIHDVGAVYAHLPKQHAEMFGRQLQALVSKYLPHARGLKIVREEKQEKAA